MIRPHDTDRILAVLGEAIEALRRYGNDHEYEDPSLEVANDLALLHGAVSAEAQRWDEEREHYREVVAHWYGKDIDVKRSEAGRLRYLHREEIELEVARGEHREDD